MVQTMQQKTCSKCGLMFLFTSEQVQCECGRKCLAMLVQTPPQTPQGKHLITGVTGKEIDQLLGQRDSTLCEFCYTQIVKRASGLGGPKGIGDLLAQLMGGAPPPPPPFGASTMPPGVKVMVGGIDDLLGALMGMDGPLEPPPMTADPIVRMVERLKRARTLARSRSVN